MGLCSPDKSTGGFFKEVKAREEATSEINVAPIELLPGASWQTKRLCVFSTEAMTVSVSKGESVNKSITSIEYFFKESL